MIQFYISSYVYVLSGFVLAAIVATFLIIKASPKMKCGLSKEGHNWVSNNQSIGNTGHSCLTHDYNTIYCSKCGKIKSITKIR